MRKEQAAIDKLKQKQICFHCVDEPYLKAAIRKSGIRKPCSYCGKTYMGYSLELMADNIEQAFDLFYIRTSDQPETWQYIMLLDEESKYEWERDGEPILEAIMNAAEVPEQAANDIQTILEDRYFDFEMAKSNEETEFDRVPYLDPLWVEVGEF